jgi:mono/diheme cytochrome c family protein
LKRLAVVLAAAGLALSGCGRDEASAPSAGTAGGAAPRAVPAGSGDAGKGKQVWLSQCVVCHNPDPSKDGPVGPAVKGASKDLLEARVLHASYPPGYAPKRPTKVMPARPDLAQSLPDLLAFLH